MAHLRLVTLYNLYNTATDMRRKVLSKCEHAAGPLL